MTNFLLIIGLLSPSAHMPTTPAQPTAQLETPAPAPLGKLVQGMTPKEAVAALGEPSFYQENAFAGVNLYWSGRPCALNKTCFARFDASGHAVNFFDFKPSVIAF